MLAHRFRTSLFVLAAALHASAAVAVVDQQQTGVDTEAEPLAINVDPGFEQKLAQTVTAGRDGDLVEVQLPVTCTSGHLIVEIVELDGSLPGTTVLGRAVVAAADLPPGDPSAFRSIRLESPVSQRRGDQFAIVLRTEDGECGLTRAPAGDTYPRGDAFFDARPNPPGWIAFEEFPGEAFDIPFRTVLASAGGGGGASEPCFVAGFGRIPFVPAFAPVCRCLADPGLREGRCAFLHPGLLLFREIPLPIPPGKSFRVDWTLMPLVPVGGKVAVTDLWPGGFDSSLGGPLVFDAAQLVPGQSLTLGYDVTAPDAGGRVRLTTEVDLPLGDEKADGTLGTRVEVGGGKTPN